MVKRYEILDGNPGHGYTLVERDTGSWVSADDYDVLEERNKDLEKTIDRLLLLQSLGGSIDVKEETDDNG